MKNRRLQTAFRSMEQPIPEAFHGFEMQQQQAQSLPVVPTSGDTLPTTLVVATAIKPTETVGSLALSLITNRPSNVDHKVVVAKAAEKAPSRVLLFPATSADATITNGTLIGTIERDDITKEVSAHTFTPESGQEAHAMVAIIEAALEAQKPKRNLASLINALNDALDASAEDGYAAPVVLLFDQTGDGVLSLKHNAGTGTITTKVADVSQEAAEAAPGTPTVW